MMVEPAVSAPPGLVTDWIHNHGGMTLKNTPAGETDLASSSSVASCSSDNHSSCGWSLGGESTSSSSMIDETLRRTLRYILHPKNGITAESADSADPRKPKMILFRSSSSLSSSSSSSSLLDVTNAALALQNDAATATGTPSLTKTDDVTPNQEECKNEIKILQQKITSLQERASASRRSAAERLSRLQSEITRTDSTIKCHTIRKSVMTKHRWAIITSLKQGLEDPPHHNREELEMECEWEVNMCMNHMEVMWYELEEKWILVRVSRRLVLPNRAGRSRTRRKNNNSDEQGKVLITGQRFVKQVRSLMVQADSLMECTLVNSIRILRWEKDNLYRSAMTLMQRAPPTQEKEPARRNMHQAPLLEISSEEDLGVALGGGGNKNKNPLLLLEVPNQASVPPSRVCPTRKNVCCSTAAQHHDI